MANPVHYPHRPQEAAKASGTPLRQWQTTVDRAQAQINNRRRLPKTVPPPKTK